MILISLPLFRPYIVVALKMACLTLKHNMVESHRPEAQNKDPGQELLDYFRPMVAIHDVVGAFPDGMVGEGIDGDAANAARAMTIPAKILYIPYGVRICH